MPDVAEEEEEFPLAAEGDAATVAEMARLQDEKIDLSAEIAMLESLPPNDKRMARLACAFIARTEVCHMMTSKLALPLRLKKLTAALKNQLGKAEKFQTIRFALDQEFDELMVRIMANNGNIVANTDLIYDLQAQVDDLEAATPVVAPSTDGVADVLNQLRNQVAAVARQGTVCD